MRHYLVFLIGLTLLFAACEKKDISPTQSQTQETLTTDKANTAIETRADLNKFLAENPNITTLDGNALEHYPVDVAEEKANGSCCLVDTPYNLSNGTNRFRTLIEFEGDTHLYFFVSRTIIDVVNQTINSYNIGKLMIEQSPNGCYSSHWIIDVDGNIPLTEPIIPGEQYRLTVAVCNDDCFKANGLSFIGE